MQAQDVAFPGEEIVANIQPGHRVQMRMHDPVGDNRRDFRQRVAAFLDRVERRVSDVKAALVGRVPLGDSRVEIPAVVIESDVGVGDERLHAVEIPALERGETDNNISDLDTRVVDVVLHLDHPALKAEEPHERVAERRVSKMPDVRGLVRVDRRMFDDDLAAGFGRAAFAPEPLSGQGRSVEKEVEVPVGRRVHTCHAGNRAERVRDLFRDRARRLPQPARQLEGDGDRQIAERAAGRNVDHDRRLIVGCNRKSVGERVGERGADGSVNGQNHRGRYCTRA